MPTATSSQTISDALHTATAMLARASESPRLDAELLLEYVTGLSRASFRASPERELPVKAGWSFQQLVKRRLQGEPIAYILGQQGFWSLLLEVSPAVLIPRPETELVVERALAHLPPDGETHLVDLGTGSGAIALAVAHERKGAQVTAVDASREALVLAARNAARLQLTNVSFLHGSWLEPVTGRRFDVVAANPPYIGAADPDLAPEVRKFEPHLALISGVSGLEALQTIVAGATEHLLPQGWLVLEHGWKQGAQVRALMVRHGYLDVRTFTDMAGRERVTEGRRA